jgi:prepilin-type N-terminal cleavage/methylation domain-containing protein
VKLVLAPKRGFTIFELLVVMFVISGLIAAALNYFFDFREEAKRTNAMNFVSYLQNAVKVKKDQMATRCGILDDWPRMEAIMQNDITEHGDMNAFCTSDQIPEVQERKFFDSGNTPLQIPVNPTNDQATFVACACTDTCDPACFGGAGFCYDQLTGAVMGLHITNTPCP